MKVYRIAGWNGHFENNRTRLLKSLDWVPMPNKHDGDGFTELMDHKNSMAHYGAWCLLVQLASKCHPRGTLMRDGDRPHDAGTISRQTRGKKADFEEAIPRLLQIGWLEETEYVSACGSAEVALSGTQVPDADVQPAGGCGEVTIEGKGREGNGIEKEGNARARALLVLTYLNERAGRDFKDCEENLKAIRMRLEDCQGDIDGCKQMIDRQVSLWKGGVMDEFLRPSTLFNKTKFRSYYDDRSRPAQGTDLNGRPKLIADHTKPW